MKISNEFIFDVADNYKNEDNLEKSAIVILTTGDVGVNDNLIMGKGFPNLCLKYLKSSLGDNLAEYIGKQTQPYKPKVLELGRWEHSINPFSWYYLIALPRKYSYKKDLFTRKENLDLFENSCKILYDISKKYSYLYFTGFLRHTVEWSDYENILENYFDGEKFIMCGGKNEL
jgi:hypothetical protein